MAGGTFENMSHEQMLAWLDQANSGTVQGAADRLAKAAEEIHKIAEELKVRPQWVEWKGEGADAFRTWTADLANSTLRLGDFSVESAKWLAQASDAIARAQAAIPRTTESAEGNLVAAASAPNDPDADTISTKSSDELAALAANKENVRLQAADEMIKLGQAYEFSAVQLNALERPKFPPPPKAFVPGDSETFHDGADQISRVSSSPGTPPVGESNPMGSTRSRDTAPDVSDVTRTLDTSRREFGKEETEPPIRMGLDSVETLPDRRTTTGPPAGPPGGGRPDGSGINPHAGWIPSVPGGEGVPNRGVPGQGRQPLNGRLPHLPGQSMPSAGPARTPGSTGIIGGRPVTPPMNGATGAIHRGTVVGAPPGTAGRTPIGPVTSTATSTGRAVGQQGQPLGRGLPSPNSGVIGGTPQRTGRTGPGGSGNTAGMGTNTGGGARGGAVGAAPSAGRPGDSSGATPRVPPSTSSPNTGMGNSARRQRRAGQDEDTQGQRSRRTAPPVID